MQKDIQIIDKKIKLNGILNYTSKNIGLVICLKKPGHYIAVIGVDEEKREIRYCDPWPYDYYPKRLINTSPFNRALTEDEFKSNVNNWYIAIG